MIDVNEIWSSDKKLKTVTGLSIQEANFIFVDFEQELRKIRRPENSSSVVGRPAKLNSKEIFLMLMIFIRHYNTYEFIALMFGIHTSNVKRWIDDSHLALGNILKKKGFARLLLINQKKLLKSILNNSEKSILMALNNLLEDQKTIQASVKITLEKRKCTLRKQC